MTKLLKYGNSKLKKEGIASWSLPAIKSCPNAGICKIGCYATQGFFNMPSVKASYARNFELAKKTLLFAPLMNDDIKRQKPKMVRIHASGDFFNEAYFKAWIAIALDNPEVKFYAYTKMIQLVKTVQYNMKQEYPDNLTIIFSQGGKQDSLININNDRHARIFESLDELHKAGYADVTEHDTGAMGPNHKIGLVYHGAKSKTFTTKSKEVA